MLNMEYKETQDNYVLAQGYYRGYEFVVKSMGTHPCAYVMIPKGYPMHTFEEFEEAINVHGGITFFSAGGLYTDMDGNKLGGTWIGWDYAHGGDAMGFRMKLFKDKMPFGEWGKQWTTAEMLEHCRKVIDQLITIKDKIEMKKNHPD